jgi:hypothetical protein
VVVTLSGAALTVILRFAFAVLAGISESVTVAVKLVGPATLPVGVPEMIPVLEFKLSPTGRAPAVMLHTYGVMPPVAASV